MDGLISGGLISLKTLTVDGEKNDNLIDLFFNPRAFSPASPAPTVHSEKKRGIIRELDSYILFTSKMIFIIIDGMMDR